MGSILQGCRTLWGPSLEVPNFENYPCAFLLTMERAEKIKMFGLWVLFRLFQPKPYTLNPKPKICFVFAYRGTSGENLVKAKDPALFREGCGAFAAVGDPLPGRGPLKSLNP